MATHLISLRISFDAGYSDRWSSTVASIRSEAKEGRSWEETSSFFVLESVKTADAFASSVYARSKFDVSRDTLLVVNATHNTYATRGKIDYPVTLASFFPRNALGLALGG